MPQPLPSSAQNFYRTIRKTLRQRDRSSDPAGPSTGCEDCQGGSIVSAVALANTKNPLIANLARCGTWCRNRSCCNRLWSARSCCNGPNWRDRLIRDMMRLLTMRLRANTYEHLLQIIVWLSLAGLSCCGFVTKAIRRNSHLFFGIGYLLIIAMVYIYRAWGTSWTECLIF
jgi:hypothetical protein